MLPTAKDVLFYEENGYYISPPILEPELIDEAWLGLQRHYAGERDVILPFSNGFADWKPTDGDGVRNSEFLCLQNVQIRRLALHPLIGQIAALLSRSTEIRLFDDQVVYKPQEAASGRSAVGWHVDQDYWQTCSSTRMLTAWIPFHDCPLDMGPLVVIPGSHQWPQDGRAQSLSFHSQDMEVVTSVWSDRSLIQKVPLTLRKGQVSFHHGRTMHCSYPNRSSSPRIALAVHLQDHRNEYKAALHPDGKPVQLFNDIVCRRRPDGNPDYKDDAVFPVLWRAA